MEFLSDEIVSKEFAERLSKDIDESEVISSWSRTFQIPGFWL